MSALKFSYFAAVSVSFLAYFFLTNDYYVSDWANSLTRTAGTLGPVIFIGSIASIFGLIARQFVREILSDRAED